MIAVAKIIGRTPDALTLMGMCVFWPPNCFLPLICFAYDTGILRSAPSMKVMNPKMNTTITRKMSRYHGCISQPSSPRAIMDTEFTSARPAVERIPTKISIDIPLPTPRSVTLSPSHIVNTAPAISTQAISINTTNTGISMPYIL